MAGKFIRGALIEFMPTFLIPLPNVIVFQFNPETITHRWTQAQAAAAPEGGTGTQSNPLAVKGVPGESFSFSLVLHADDMISRGGPVAAGIATATGVYARLAALEMVQCSNGAFAGGGLLGSVSASVSVSAGGVSLGGSAAGSASAQRSVPASLVPTVLFVWGPGRIVPVRVTGLSITEKLYDGLLKPTYAEVQIELRVLTPDELAKVTGPLAGVATVAYTYPHGLRQALAAANLADSVDPVIRMLPI